MEALAGDHAGASFLSGSGEHVFATLHDLALLPYFDCDGERLALRDRSLGPILDVHAHLALAFVLPLGIDMLGAAPAPVDHYLPARSRIDLDVYANRNLSSERLRAIQLDLGVRSLFGGCCAGARMRATHTATNLLHEMEALGIERSVLLPIDFPALSRNAETALSVARAEARLIAFGSVHPFSPRLTERLDQQVALGARGVKVHPAVQCVPPDHPRAVRLYRLCGERLLPVLWHCGPVGIEPALWRRLSQVRLYERPIAECPATTFFLGHAGALQVDEALDLQLRYPNVVLEISCQSLANVGHIVERGDPERIVYGSDWPFYSQAITLAKVLLVTEGRRGLRRKILYENAARILQLPR